jgi:hypothetical protein
MRVDVQRYIAKGNPWKEIHTEKNYKGCRLHLNKMTAELVGPKWAFIAQGLITEIGASYSGADYHIRLELLVEFGSNGLRRSERWFIRFLDEKGEQT